MQNVSKIVKIIAFVAFVYGGQLFGGVNFAYTEWRDKLEESTNKTTQIIIKNNIEYKLQETKCQSKEDLDEGYTCFGGEIEVIGMLVREESRLGDILYVVLDKNFRLPIMEWGKPSLTDVILLTKGSATLPQPLQKRTFGGVGIMAKIKIKDYKYLHKYGYMDNDLYIKATLMEATPFANEEYKYIHKLKHYDETDCVGMRECDSCIYSGVYSIFKGNTDWKLLIMHYNSKDSFVNLRDSPNGKVITKIYAKDMRCGKEKGRIYLIDEDTKSMGQIASGKKKWLKVYYLPTIEITEMITKNDMGDYLDVSKAIFGYIHSSQLKVSCK
ncbi:hypothetical protein [Helicobacter sp. 23-1045]